MRQMTLYLPREVGESELTDFLISVKAFEISGTEKYWNYCLGSECIYHISLFSKECEVLQLSILGKDEFIKSFCSDDIDTKTMLEELVLIEQELSKVIATLASHPKDCIGFAIGRQGNRAVFEFVREMQRKWQYFAIENSHGVTFIDIPGFSDIISVEKFMSLEEIAKERGFL